MLVILLEGYIIKQINVAILNKPRIMVVPSISANIIGPLISGSTNSIVLMKFRVQIQSIFEHNTSIGRLVSRVPVMSAKKMS